MRSVILVETQSFLDGACGGVVVLSIEMAKRNTSQVYLWLMQNGVLLLRDDPSCMMARVYSEPAVRVFVDEFALMQRGIEITKEESKHIVIAQMYEFVEQMVCNDSKTIWH